MSISYIPEDTYAVCTYQMGAKPQKFIASRSKVSVFHKDKKPFLTIEDKNLDVEFTCKSPVNIASSFLAFGARLIVGALLVSNPIGWIVAGCLVVAVGVAYTVKAINHQCTSPMKAGQWVLYQPNVKFNGHNAITQMSMLSCSSGGIVKPFFSYSLACSAAKNIRKNNRIEVGINVGVSFFAGLLAPLGITKTIGKYGFVKGIGYITGTNIAGLGITWTLQYGQREWIRIDNDFDDNQIYQDMNEEVDDNSFFGQIDEPSDLNDADAIVSLAGAVKEGDIVTTNQQLKNDLAKLEGLSNYKLKKSELAQQIVKDLNDGNYGQGTLVVTIDDNKIPEVDKNRLEKIMTNFPQLIRGTDLNHKNAFLNYLIDRNFELSISENKIEGLKNNKIVVGEFDELDRLKSLNGKI